MYGDRRQLHGCLGVGVVWWKEGEIAKCKRKLWGVMDMFLILTVVRVLGRLHKSKAIHIVNFKNVLFIVFQLSFKAVRKLIA